MDKGTKIIVYAIAWGVFIAFEIFIILVIVNANKS